MTFKELQKRVAPIAAELEQLAREAEADEFAPWVVATLEKAAYFAALSDEALMEAHPA